MNIKIKLIFLLLLLTLIFSCVKTKSTEIVRNNPELAVHKTSDTLKFKSGIRAIFQDSKKAYWIGSHNEGLSHYDGNSFEYFTVKDGLADNQIRSIQEDANGIIWFGTANGVSSYNGKTIKNHTANENLKNQWMKTGIDLWFNAGNKEGVYKYDGQKLNYLAFPKPTAIPTGNIYAVTSISKGKNKMLWFGTYAGVLGYNGSNFTILNDETLGFDHMNDRMHVRSIYEDSQGRLWIGNNGIGVILKSGDSIINFSRVQGKLIPVNEFSANIQSQQLTKNTGLQSVFAITEDKEGNIWFGDRDSGAWKYDGKTLTNYIIDTKLNSQMIWCIYEDQNKNLLFGMASAGIYKFNGKSFEKWL